MQYCITLNIPCVSVSSNAIYTEVEVLVVVKLLLFLHIEKLLFILT